MVVQSTWELEPQLAAIMASEPEALADPYPVWRQLREQTPVHRTSSAVLLSRYADVKRLLREATALSNRGRIDGARAEEVKASLSPEQLEAFHQINDFEGKFLARSNGEPHRRLRAIAHQALTPRRVAELRDVVQRYADTMVDRMAEEGDTNLVRSLAYPLPLRVICDMLEVPEPDREAIKTWSDLIGRNRGGDDPAALMAARDAQREFRAYVGVLLEERRRHPGTDLVSALMEAEAGERLTEEELTAMFVVLLFAGHETTTNLIANGMLALHRNPSQWRRLCADPDGRAVPATEELLRHVSPVQFLDRVAVEPVDLGDERVQPGETVYLMVAAANRDPDVFEDPERLDLERPGAMNHVALGFGPHFCLGNAIARMEGQVAFATLARRFPRVEVQTAGLRWRGHWKLRGLVELPARMRR